MEIMQANIELSRADIYESKLNEMSEEQVKDVVLNHLMYRNNKVRHIESFERLPDSDQGRWRFTVMFYPVRTMKDLLQVMLNHIKRIGVNEPGLCCLANTLRNEGVFTREESDSIKQFISDYGPRKRHGFFGRFNWPESEVEPRKRWLEFHINMMS